MRTILKKELRAFLEGAVGWVLLATLLFAQGLFFVTSNLSMGAATLGRTLELMMALLLLLLPLFAVRLNLCVREKGEELWLSTLPITPRGLWLGRYTALLILFLLPSLPLLLLPPIMSLYGAVQLLPLYLSVLGYLLAGAALLALLLFVTGLFQRAWAGYLVGVLASAFCGFGILDVSLLLPAAPWLSLLLFLLLFAAVGLLMALLSRRPLWGVGVAAAGILPTAVCYLIRPAAFTDLFARFLEKLDLYSYVADFMVGRLDLGGILFCASYTVFFLFLTVALAEGRRRA